jgi:ferric-dicitrate binding protein FerR (iron transport regulator)
MTDDERNDYLWDGSGPADPEVQRLESLLRPLGHSSASGTSAPPLPLPPRVAHSNRIVRALRPALAIAATVLIGVTVWFWWGSMRGGWTVQTIAGAPQVDGRALGDDGLLKRGGRLVTDGSSRARISVGRIGRVDVDPDTRVELVNAGGTDHRLSLERGTIHARISAPPRFFNVNTPSAVAVDLGCAYTLHVDDSGAGMLRVTHGWVAFDYNGREAFIPQGAVGATRPGVGPGTPRYEDAPSGYAEALAVLDFGSADAPVRAAALDLILSSARSRDTLTLWHLLSRGSADERARVYDRLAMIAPPPRGVTRDGVLSGNREALMTWWDALGFEGTRWWQRLKKKY